MENNKMNVAIIGAGINGLYLGLKLVKKGHKVTIFEKNLEPGNKVCSGLFSSRILDLIPESEKLIENRIDSAILHFLKKDIKISFSKEFFVMDHSELDKLMAEKAISNGVNIFFNRDVKKFPFGFDRTVGADGANSIVRKMLKLKSPKMKLGIKGYSYLNEKGDASCVETWPTKNGFCWKIPRRDKIEYGIIEDINTANKIFDEFIRKNKIEIENISSKLIPQGLVIPSNSLITLCGDALGLTKPWSGGGVIWGLFAADILVENFPDFLKYRRKVLNFFLPKIIIGKTARNVGVWIGFNMPYLLPKNIKIESDFLL